jgi:DNA-binding NarL/FixJ family response regulator
VVEDDALFRDLLAIGLERQDGIEVAGVYADGEDALAAIPADPPDVALLDIDLGPGLTGIQLGMHLRERLPTLGIVLLSNHWIPRFLAGLPPDSMAGWCYLLKRSVSDVAALGRAIEGAAAGLVVLDPHLVAGRRPREGSALGRLTQRQREILDLIAAGYTNAAIADRLVLSPRTIENQLNQLYRELGLAADQRELNPRVRAALVYIRESSEAPGTR